MLKPLITLALLGAVAFAAQAVEFRSADVHNADDYPTVAAVKYMAASHSLYALYVNTTGAV